MSLPPEVAAAGRRLLAHSAVRYVMVGALAYVIEIGALVLLTRVARMADLPAVSIAFWVGFLAAFALQKTLAFRDTSQAPSRLARQAVLYAALVGVNFVVTVAFVHLTGRVLDVVVARTIALAVTTVWNYLAYRHVIFPAPPTTGRCED